MLLEPIDDTRRCDPTDPRRLPTSDAKSIHGSGLIAAKCRAEKRREDVVLRGVGGVHGSESLGKEEGRDCLFSLITPGCGREGTRRIGAFVMIFEGEGHPRFFFDESIHTTDCFGDNTDPAIVVARSEG